MTNTYKEISLEAINNNTFSLEFADDSLKKDKEIVLEVVKKCGLALEFADSNLKKDKEIVLKAVKQNGFALEFADNCLKKDKDVVLEAINRNGFALEFADDCFKKYEGFINYVANQTGNIFMYTYIYKYQISGKEFNNLLPDAKLRKRIKSDMVMNNFKYQIGMNTDTIKFNTKKDCCAGGLYFTNDVNLKDFSAEIYGYDIYEIKIPDDSTVYIEDFNKAKASSIEVIRKIN